MSNNDKLRAGDIVEIKINNEIVHSEVIRASNL